MTMNVWQVAGSFGLEHLTLTTRPIPEPGPGQVRLKMRAMSLNYRDLLTVQGLYNPRQPLPLIPLSDGAGVIDAVGPGVTRWKGGEHVSPIFAQAWRAGEPTRDKLRSTLGGPLDGTAAEYAVFDAESVVALPDTLSDVEAASLPCAAVTAWSALITQYPLRAGELVLTQGTGGVSLFALQFARAHGAEVIITSSSDEKLERARALGATHTLNYASQPQWGKAAREFSPGGQGVDHIIEVGGAGTLEQSLRAVKIGGHISLIGVLSGTTQELNVIPILMQNIRIQGVLVGHRESFEAMLRAMSALQIAPVISHTFAFDELPQAFELMQRGGHFGKIAITL